MKYYFWKKSFSGKTAFYKLHFSVNPFVGLNYESFFTAIFCLQMGGCCTSSTPLRLISNSGFHISEHGLVVLVDVWNELRYSRHIKDVWMDHLTGICFKSSHSSALAWLSWYTSKSCVPLASLSLFYLWQSQARSHLLLGTLEQQLRGHILASHCGDDQALDRCKAQTYDSLIWEAGYQLCLWLSLLFEFLTVGLLIHLHLVWQGSLYHSERRFLVSHVAWIQSERNRDGPPFRILKWKNHIEAEGGERNRRNKNSRIFKYPPPLSSSRSPLFLGSNYVTKFEFKLGILLFLPPNENIS